MIYRLYSNSFRLFSTIISKTNSVNMNKCYFRHTQQEDKIDISFLLDVRGTNRQFNFSRKSAETVQALLSRIKTNIQKVINKTNKKKRSSVTEDFETVFFNDKNAIINDNYACIDLFEMQGSIKLKIFDIVYEVVFNPPWILSINIPESILAGFPVYPEYFEVQHAHAEKSTFNWYKGEIVNDKGKTISDLQINWSLVGSDYAYTPSAQDVGMKLKLECIPVKDLMVGPAVEVVSKSIVAAGPGQCPFEIRHMFTKLKLDKNSFRCVSYNILADLYCDSDYTRTVLHPYCPPYALHIDYRKQLIIKELLGYNSDIICLQEVDSKIFRHCLTPILGSEGLAGKYYKKGKEVAEGLACYYRKDRFKYVGEEIILLAEALKTKPCLKQIWDKIENNTPLIERLLDRSTIASATFLNSMDNPNELLIVANTHLYFHPDADHIRLIQGGIIIYWLTDLQKNMKLEFIVGFSLLEIELRTPLRLTIPNEENLVIQCIYYPEYPEKRISLILCGDFNSVPTCGIYQLYTTGVSPSTLPDWKSNINEAVYGLDLQQSIPLESACGTPTYTNFTAEFADCLDYIFYEKTNIEVEQVVPLPSVEELKLHTALPSVVFPSDHLALVSDLRFR